MSTKICKAEKLLIAGTVAPLIRSGKGKRAIKVTNAAGEVVRFVDEIEVLRAVTEQTEIVIQVQKDKLPDMVLCAVCKVPVERKSNVPKYCRTCVREAAREANRKCKAKNREANREAARKYRAKNLEAGREYAREHRAKNPEAARETDRKHRAKKRAEKQQQSQESTNV